MRHLGPIQLTLAALICLGSPHSSWAQSTVGRFKLGPFSLTPSLDLNAGRDTNVFNAEAAATPDGALTVVPRLFVGLPIGRRMRLTGTGAVDFVYFRRQKSERSVDRYGDTRLEVDVSRFKLFGGGGARSSKQRFSTDLDERIQRHENSVNAGFSVRVATKLSATLSSNWSRYSFGTSAISGTAVQEALDRNQRGLTAQLRYSLSGQTALLLSGEAIQDRFVRETTGGQPTRSSRYQAGLEFGQRAVINGQILAGIRDVPSGQGTPRFRGLVMGVATSLRLASLGLLSVSTLRDLAYSGAYTSIEDDVRRGRDTLVSTSVAGEIMLELPFRFSGTGSIGFLEAKYLSPFQIGGASRQRVDHVWTAGGSVLRHFGDKLRVGGAIARSHRSSSLPGFSYVGWRYGLRLQIVP